MSDTGTYLAIDTGGLFAIAGVRLNGSVKSQRGSTERGQGSDLAGLVENTLSSSGIKFADLNGLIVSLGPGSFTGLRVGLAYAKGLALALKTPLVGVDRIQQARHQFDDPGAYCALRMKTNEYYVWKITPNGDADVSVKRLDDPNAWFHQSESSRNVKIYWCDGALPNSAKELFHNKVSHESVTFEIDSLISVGHEMLSSGMAPNWMELEPHYGALSAAEKKRAVNQAIEKA